MIVPVYISFEITIKEDGTVLQTEFDSAVNALFRKLKKYTKTDNDDLYHAVQAKIKHGVVTQIKTLKLK